MSELFLNEKPVRTLIVLRQSAEDMYCSKISKKIDTTYAHTIKILSRLEDRELIQTKKEGRRKYIRLTSTGETRAEKFQELLNTFEEDMMEKETEVNTKLEMNL